MAENNFFEGNGLVILLLFFLMFGGGFGFGGYGNAVNNGVVTRAEMHDALNIHEVQRNQADIKDGICGLNNQIMQSRYDMAIGDANISQQIAENRYAAALQAQNAQAQMASCCCDLKGIIHAENEATRNLIQQQTIDDLKNQLNQAQNAIANTVQSNNLINTLGSQLADFRNSMGRWYANPPVVPYYAYGNFGGYGNFNGYGMNNGCGCGCA